MDFSPDATAVAVADVVDNVVARHDSNWESGFADPGGFETGLWSAIGEAGLTALPLPDSVGGDNVPVDGLLPMVTAIGAAGGVAPVIAEMVVPALAIRASGVIERLGAQLAAGGHLAIAINEPARPLPQVVTTTLADGVLNGVKSGVLHAENASALIVEADAGVVVVAPTAQGVTVQRSTSSSGWGEYSVRFSDVAVDPADVVTGPAGWLSDHYLLGIAAYADGLIDGAAKLAAKHVTEREQFAKPIGTFQAVQQQIADIYVVARAQHLASLAAAWQLANELDAQSDLTLAAYWLAQELPAAMRTLTHLHGGVGVDITYPLHRYYSIAKDLARLVGGPVSSLDRYAEKALRPASEKTVIGA